MEYLVMRLSQIPMLICLCLLVLPACGFDAEGCGPGEIKADGMCVLLEPEDEVQSTDANEDDDLADGIDDAPSIDEPIGDDDGNTGEHGEAGDVGHEY